MSLINFTNFRSASFAVCLGLVTACSGAADKSANTPAPQAPQTAEEIALSKEHSQLPAAVVVRVPVDANGNELSDQAEMRTSAATEVSTVNTEGLFASAQPARIASSADELDADSSTQSFQDLGGGSGFDYNYNPLNNNGYGKGQNQNQNQNQNGYGQGQGQGGGYGQGQGQGGGYGQGQGQGGCGGSSWCGYTPRSYSIVSTASYWAFPKPTCYGFGGYNYYWYPRPSCSPWAWCGRGY